MLYLSLLQQNYKVGALRENALKIELCVKRLPKEIDLAITSELSLTGYPPRDLLLWSSFFNEVNTTLQHLAKVLKGYAPVLVGFPIKKSSKLFNAVCLLKDGVIKDIFLKNQLPQCNIFDEQHYFSSSNRYFFFRLKEYNICVTICRDLWSTSADNSIYDNKKLEEHIQKNRCDLLINLSSSPFWLGKYQERCDVAEGFVRRYKIPLVYVNQVGANGSIIFDGSSFIMDSNGEIVCKMDSFVESSLEYSLQIDGVNKSIPIMMDKVYSEDKYSLFYDAIILGIRDYFKKSGISHAIIGLSGGIDSSLTAVLATKALGSSHVFGILMPSCYTSEQSNQDAQKIANNLNIQRIECSIEQYQKYFEEDLSSKIPFFIKNNCLINEQVVWENLQARIRGVYLMSIANFIGGAPLVTSNKSEIAVGYCTIYGDTCGALAPLGDLYKTEVYELSAWINKQHRDMIDGYIPYSIMERFPTAELRLDQYDQQILPPYEVLDKILKLCIEDKLGIQEIIKYGYECSVVIQVLTLLKKSEFKRQQLPPLLKLHKYSFDEGWRVPIVMECPMFDIENT